MADSKEPCVVCLEYISSPYTIQCGSSTPHIICSPCELAWRLKSLPTPEGRTITCPLCRAVEKDTSKRSTESLRAELSHVYFELATKNGKSGIPSYIIDYIRLLESISRVPHIQLDGVRTESRVRMTLRERHAARQEAQENQRQIELRERAERAAVARQARADRIAAERQARTERAAAERLNSVWCESGNIALGLCQTSRKTNRTCTYLNCTKRVCFRCDKCISH